MTDAQTLAKIRLHYGQVIKDLTAQIAENAANYADNLARQGEQIRKGQHEEALANDLVMDLHTVINRLTIANAELETLLLKSKTTDKITEPKKKE